MRIVYGIILILLLVPDVGFSQASKTRVAVTHTGDDYVGQAVAFALKEAIRASHSFVLFELDYKNPAIVVRLVSVESYRAQKGISSAVAVNITYDRANLPGYGILLANTVLSCGRDRAEGCAKAILPDIGQTIDDLRRINVDLWQQVILK